MVCDNSSYATFLSFINTHTMSTTSFCNGQSWSKSDAYYHQDDSGCWEDYLSFDEYEEILDQKRYEQSMRVVQRGVA